MAGLGQAFRQEAAFRQEVVCCCLLLPLAFLLGNNGLERGLLTGSLLLVLVVELLNTAIEAVVDLVCDEWRPLAGKAKDCGSAAVFLSLVNVVLVWGAVLL